MKFAAHRQLLLRTSTFAGALWLAVMGASAAADTRALPFDIPKEPLSQALKEFSRASGEQIVFSEDLVRGRQSPVIKGHYTPDHALALLLQGTALETQRTGEGVIMVRARRIPAPQFGGATAGARVSKIAAAETLTGSTMEGLVVTAQKRREQIQDVPIAISAFSADALQAQKIEGGFDLLKAIPNVTFSKNNFTGFNFSIRGIGTKAISATTDPGVSVAFNNTGLIQNRLFEQEYFDIERVEVLRGPQGTLYGRNATAGVINVITEKADVGDFDGSLKGEVGNYDTKRLSGFVNVPLIEDVLAVRFAGATTTRSGFDFNTGTDHRVNGRDLWSGRLSIGFEPTERVRADFIWERFNEEDDRSRTGKQLCHHDDGPEFVGDFPTNSSPKPFYRTIFPVLFSAGCKPGSLYDDAAFGTPNGLALPFVFSAIAFGTDCGPTCTALYPVGYNREGRPDGAMKLQDPYGDMMQSRDLREINSIKDPIYRANADILELNIDIHVTDKLTFTSQTAYNDDSVYSFQDFNRFNTVPVFLDTAQLTRQQVTPENPTGGGPSFWANVAPNGVFCDPQLGCSSSIAGFDISKGEGEQFSQELRLQSAFDGPVNFSVGMNYTRFKTEIDYYIFFNIITLLAMLPPLGETNTIDKCGVRVNLPQGGVDTELHDWSDPICNNSIYIDPTPIESLAGDGHNYFRSRNPYTLKSGAVFGEVYWNITDALKLTAGARYTDDQKDFVLIPSQVLMVPGPGNVNRGYPTAGTIKQHWGEWSGRLGLDWKPDLAFTDETLLYAFYSRGYKGGGANPPGIDWAEDFFLKPPVSYGPTFDPEFVNAFEVGSKNTLLGGAVTLNTGAFYYDYEGYQVSQIKDRTAVNENFDAKIWGLEFEATIAPSEDLLITANLGYLDTEIAGGEKSLNVADRTLGDPNYVLVKPFPFLPSNCVAPAHIGETLGESGNGEVSGVVIDADGNAQNTHYWGICSPGFFPAWDAVLNKRYDPTDYPELNNGAGLLQDVGGNELPNSPHWTISTGAQYSFNFLEGWDATVRGDAYWQSQSWARVYNAVNDKLHGWYNLNMSFWIEKADDDLKIEFYVKNVLDKSPITDAFINSDDTGLTTNVFTLDPRLIGLQITKGF